jgi:nitroreductase
MNTPVNKQDIEHILKNAIWAPNWGNTQPWEITVLNSELVKELSKQFVRNLKAEIPPDPDLEMPVDYPTKNKKRYVILARDLFNTMGIKRQDKESRMEYYINMYSFFHAPAAIYLCMDKEISPAYGAFNLGALCMNISLLAHDKGLGTCVMACLCHYPDVIRKVTGIPENRNIVIGIALGYPDYEMPVNKFKSTRDEDVISWHGF